MIFVTVGTEKFSFDRLIMAIDEAKRQGTLKDEVFMQIGNARYTPTACHFERFLSFQKLLAAIETAQVVVSHAGIGSTLLCLHSGKVPIIFPRNTAYREHLDDHQQDFARHIQKLQVALVSFEAQDLIDKVLRYEECLRQLPGEVSQNERNRLVNYLKGGGGFPSSSTGQAKGGPNV